MGMKDQGSYFNNRCLDRKLVKHMLVKLFLSFIYQVKVGQTSRNVFTVRLTTDQVAPYTWLEAPGIRGRFSDNGFVMVDRVVFVKFYAWEPTTNTDVENIITLTSLMNIYE